MIRLREIFATAQGEGPRAGRRSVFIRLAGCNMWSGREEDRASAPGACGAWCDTSFRDGDPQEVADIVQAARVLWGAKIDMRLATITGGEPLLQDVWPLVDALHDDFFEVEVETNGSRDLCRGAVAYVVSPKKNRDGRFDLGDGDDAVQDLKLVMAPEVTVDEALILGDLARWTGRFVQPLWCGGAAHPESVTKCLDVVRRDPRFRVSVQAHKYLGVP